MQRRTLRKAEVYSHSYRITFSDMDPDYRLTPAAGIAFFQDTVAAYLTTRGLAVFDLQPEGRTWVISDLTLDVCGRLPIWRETVLVKVSPAEITSVKVHFDYEIIDGQGDSVMRGGCCWIPIDLASGKPVRLDEFVDVEGESDVRHPRLHFPDLTEYSLENSHVIDINDMDFNRHMNNIRYLRVALAALPLDYMDRYDIVSVRMKFIRQSFIGETLRCRHQFTDASCLERVCSIINTSDEEVCRLVIRMNPREEIKDPRDIVSRKDSNEDKI